MPVCDTPVTFLLIACLTVCLCLTVGCKPNDGNTRIAPQAEPAEAPRPLILRIDAKDDLPAYEYAVYLPSQADIEKPWPTILFLHGAGMRGDDINRIKTWPMAGQPMKPDFPFLVVMPQCPAGEYWNPDALLVMLDEIKASYPVDTARIYLTGQSMGGYGTWKLACQSPQTFAAIAPLCGGGDPNRAKALARMPIWVFHGEQDKVVPLAKTDAMVQAVKTAGGHPKVTVYPKLGHQIWQRTYSNPNLYVWFLDHAKK